MKALRVKSLSSDLSGVELADMPTPERKTGEVLVKVHAASLNFPDLLMTKGEYQFKPEAPFTAGLEMAGVVLEADEGSIFAGVCRLSQIEVEQHRDAIVRHQNVAGL